MVDKFPHLFIWTGPVSRKPMEDTAGKRKLFKPVWMVNFGKCMLAFGKQPDKPDLMTSPLSIVLKVGGKNITDIFGSMLTRFKGNDNWSIQVHQNGGLF